MELPWQNIEGFSGATAVGSLVFIDLAVIADAFAGNLFPIINVYAETPTWAQGPVAVLLLPIVLLRSATKPIPVLLTPLVLR